MAHIHPFAAVRYARRADLNLSKLIAPPFDVLGEADKAALQAKHANNIVTIDVPHLPPKSAGPPAKYAQANATFEAWLDSGVMIQEPRIAFYPYTQIFDHRGRKLHRHGFFALVRLSPFGQGQVVPHEKTYAGAIEDRLALMRAMRMQLSPIFGLYSDPRNEVSGLLQKNLSKPELSAELDGVRHEMWSVWDAEVVNPVIDALVHKPVYIADGHHRYTTALEYQRLATEAAGEKLNPAHPANYCMFVLVAMQDDGLLILPTHRMIGGMDRFDVGVFRQAVGSRCEVVETAVGPQGVAAYGDDVLPKRPPHTMALYDGLAGKVYELRFNDPDVLAALEPGQSQAWRHLDVAILQRYLLDEVIGPRFAPGRELVKGYTADAAQVGPQTNGVRYQIALLLQPTPLRALEELGKHGEVMPQKSTYFYPKLATGMALNSLR